MAVDYGANGYTGDTGYHPYSSGTYSNGTPLPFGSSSGGSSMPGAMPPLGSGGNTSWTNNYANTGNPNGVGSSGGNGGGFNDLLNGSAAYAAQTLAMQQKEADARIADLQGRLALAKTADERAQAALELQAAQQEKAQYLNLAMTLLNAANASRGPRDWDSYLATVNNGRDVLSALFGGKGRPAVEQAAANGGGFSGAPTVLDTLKSLGVDLSQYGGNTAALARPTHYVADALAVFNQNGRNGPAAWQAAVPGLSAAEAQAVSDRMRNFYLTNKTPVNEDQAKAIIADVTGGRIGSTWGQPTQQTTLGTTAPPPDYASQLDAAYKAQQAANGGAAPTFDQQVAMYQNLGLSPADAAAAVNYGRTTYAQTGGGQPYFSALNAYLTQKLNPQTATPATPQIGPGASAQSSSLVQQMMGGAGAATDANPVRQAMADQPAPAWQLQDGRATPQQPDGANVTSQTYGQQVMQAANPKVVSPWQVSVADWDRDTADPSAKQRVYGYLETQGHDPASYEYALNQTRPHGAASTDTSYGYKQPAGAYG